MSATDMPRLRESTTTLDDETTDGFYDNPNEEQKYDVEVSTLCRVCGKREAHSNMIGIFSPRGEQLQIQVKLHQHLSVNIKKDDVLPLQLCLKCWHTLESFHEMYELSIKVNERLCKYLTRATNSCVYNSSTSYEPPNTPITAIFVKEERTSPIPENEDHDTNNSDRESVNSQPCTEDVTAKDTASEEPSCSSVNIPGKKPKPSRLLATLTCPICKATLKGVNQLQRHCVTDHKKYKCTRCEDMFDSDEKRKEHQSTAHSFTCWCCGEVASTEKVLIDHFKDVHPEEKPFKCPTCGQCCKTERYLIGHLETHGEAKKYICDTCGEAFKTAVVLGYHRKSHLELSESHPHNCTECGQAFHRLSKLKIHMRRHTGEKPFQCKKCPKNFHTQASLKLHESVHVSDRKHTCELCGVSYRHSRNLYDHKVMKHSGGFDFKCLLCSNTYKSEAEVLEHVQDHSEAERTAIPKDKSFMQVSNYQCHECGIFFINKQKLIHHVKKPHGPNAAKRLHDADPSDNSDLRKGMKSYCPRNFSDDGKEFECDQCGKKLATKVSLTTHKRMHLKQRPFVCKSCNKGFTLKSLLVDHMRVHSGEMPFECDMCEKKFHRSRNLNLHKKRVHLDLRPHQCRFCEKTFKVHSSRTVHERIHTGSKPYSCEICNRTFTQKPELNQHRKRNTCSQAKAVK